MNFQTHRLIAQLSKFKFINSYKCFDGPDAHISRGKPTATVAPGNAGIVPSHDRSQTITPGDARHNRTCAHRQRALRRGNRR